MQSQWERWVFVYDSIVEPHPEEALQIHMPLEHIVRALEPRQKNGDSVKLINNETAAIRILDLEVNQQRNVVTFLIQYADKNVADPVFSHFDTGQLRTEPKLDGEGVAVSTHLMVSLTPTESTSPIYLSVLEDVIGIGKSKLEPFFKSEFRAVFEKDFRTDSGTMNKCWPTLRLHGHMDQSLREELKEGSVSGVELIRLTKGEDDLDEDGAYEETKRAVTLRLSQPKSNDDTINILNRIKNRAAEEGFDRMRVIYKKAKGKQRSVLFGTAREDAAEAVVVRCENFRSTEALPQCSERIIPSVRDHLFALLSRLREDGDNE